LFCVAPLKEYVAELAQHAANVPIVLVNAGYPITNETALSLCTALGARAYARVDVHSGDGVKELFQCVISILWHASSSSSSSPSSFGKSKSERCAVQ
jgi:hypothetical protein